MKIGTETVQLRRRPPLQRSFRGPSALNESDVNTPSRPPKLPPLLPSLQRRPADPNQILIHQHLLLNPIHNLLQQGRSHLAQRDRRHPGKPQDAGLQREQQVIRPDDQAWSGDGDMNSRVGLLCRFEDGNLGFTL